MVAFLLALAIVFGCTQTLSLKFFKVDNLKSRLFIYVFFLALTAIISSIPLLFRSSIFILPSTVIVGMVFGLVFILCILFYNLAIESGPLYLSGFYFSASMLIPTAAGIIFWNEATSITTYIAIILFLFAFYFINAKTSKHEKKTSAKWLIYCVMTFLLNGTLATTMKLNAELTDGMGSIEFVSFSFAFATVFCFLVYLFLLIKDKYKSIKTDIHSLKQNKLPILAAAISSSVLNLLVAYLAGLIPSSYLQPIVQGGVIIAVTLSSLVFFKEKLSRKNLVGIILGISAIILINI